MNALYAVEWEESERGWGTRPDGFSFHKSEDDALKFVKDFQDRQPKGYVPDEYSRPIGFPKLLEVSVGLVSYVNTYGDCWLDKNRADAYKNYDAQHLFDAKEK